MADIQSTASDIIQSGKPMSTASIMLALGKASLNLGKEVSDKDRGLRQVVAQNAKTAQLRTDIRSRAASLSKMVNGIEDNLAALGKSRQTQSLQQNYLQQFTPLKAEVIDRTKEREQLLEQLNVFMKEQQGILSTLFSSSRSPEEIKTTLQGQGRKQQDLATQAAKLTTNEESLQSRLYPIQVQTHKDMITAKSSVSIAQAPPELE